MKNFTALRLIICTVTLISISFNSTAQQTNTATSDGDWNDPNIWSLASVPSQEDSIVIDANVTITGPIYNCFECYWLIINQGKSLSNNYINGTTLLTPEGIINNGDIISTYPLLIGADIRNNGNILLSSPIVIGGSIENNGTLQSSDSVTIGVFLENNGTINIDLILTIGDDFTNNNITNVTNRLVCGETLMNSSILTADTIVLYSGTNEGTIEAISIIIIEEAFTNYDNIESEGLVITEGEFDNYGRFETIESAVFGDDFVNHSTGVIEIGDTLLNEGELINNGQVRTKHLVNEDQILGDNGSFCISDIFRNYSAIGGNIDICDATANGALDLNSGIISNTVTYCVSGSCSTLSTSFENENAFSFSIFPNPAESAFQINMNEQMALFTLYDLSGRKAMDAQLIDPQTTINTLNLVSGIYTYSIQNSIVTITGKLVIK